MKKIWDIIFCHYKFSWSSKKKRQKSWKKLLLFCFFSLSNQASKGLWLKMGWYRLRGAALNVALSELLKFAEDQKYYRMIWKKSEYTKLTCLYELSTPIFLLKILSLFRALSNFIPIPYEFFYNTSANAKTTESHKIKFVSKKLPE